MKAGMANAVAVRKNAAPAYGASWQAWSAWITGLTQGSEPAATAAMYR